MAKVALLIGVGNYKHPDAVKPLVSAPKDVAAMQQILLNPQMGEFTEVIPLIDPDPMEMQEAIETLYRDRAPDDTVLLFFSGHGIKDESGKLYFATRLTRKTPKGELVKSTAVPARFVQEIMGNSRSRRQVMILDCCFSGAFDPALNAKADGSVDLQEQLGAKGRVVLTSSSSTEYSFEQQGSDLSIYTRFLVEGIETGAADRDNDGKVSARELHEYATKKVQETAPKMNPKIIVLKDEGFDVVFAKAQITDPKLKYRKEAERYSERGEISLVGRTLLNTLRAQLPLTLEETQEIEAQVLQPFRERLRHLETYRSTFVAAVERQYPLTPETLLELKDLQEILGLRKENVTQIEEDVTAQLASKSAAYRQNLQRYEQEFTRAIQVEFPLSQYVCEGLDKFQVDLGLTNEDVARVKQPIIQRRAAEDQQQQLELQRQLEQQRQRDAENLRKQQEAERLEIERQREQEYQQNLQRYEQELYKVIRSNYPIDTVVREGLRNFQQTLKLKDGDITRIESPILQVREAEYQKHQWEKLRQQQEAARIRQQQNLAHPLGKDGLHSEKGIDYTCLRDLLEIGDWAEADRETYRVMIQAVGKKEGDNIDLKDLLDFPCVDLRTIDRLWVKYSNGKFGFSVQKQIYIECGAKLGGKEPSDKVWRRFYACVGWSNSLSESPAWKSLDYNELFFTIQIPQGQLPYCMVDKSDGEFATGCGFFIGFVVFVVGWFWACFSFWGMLSASLGWFGGVFCLFLLGLLFGGVSFAFPMGLASVVTDHGHKTRKNCYKSNLFFRMETCKSVSIS